MPSVEVLSYYLLVAENFWVMKCRSHCTVLNIKVDCLVNIVRDHHFLAPCVHSNLSCILHQTCYLVSNIFINILYGRWWIAFSSFTDVKNQVTCVSVQKTASTYFSNIGSWNCCKVSPSLMWRNKAKENLAWRSYLFS